MRVRTHDGLRKPQIIPSTSAVVEDDYGNPLLVAVQYDDGTYMYSKLGDDDFHSLLRTLGIQKTVVIKEVCSRPLSNVIWTP